MIRKLLDWLMLRWRMHRLTEQELSQAMITVVNILTDHAGVEIALVKEGQDNLNKTETSISNTILKPILCTSLTNILYIIAENGYQDVDENDVTVPAGTWLVLEVLSPYAKSAKAERMQACFNYIDMCISTPVKTHFIGAMRDRLVNNGYELKTIDTLFDLCPHLWLFPIIHAVWRGVVLFPAQLSDTPATMQ